jgi:hypothetical protein
VIDTVVPSYLPLTSVTSGSAAKIATFRNETKYAELAATHIFMSIALQSLGSVSAKTPAFLRELSRRLTRAPGELRESPFLYQRLSVAIQRCNAVRLRNNFSDRQLVYD